jgi:cellulose synthase (UDP-forming)
MDDHPSDGAIEALLDLMGRIGDATGVPASGVTIALGASPDQLGDHDVLVIGSAALTSGALFDGAPVHFDGGALHVTERSALQYMEALMGGWGHNSAEDVDNAGYTSKGFSGITGFESPITPGRSVVALVADDPATLPQLVAGMNDDKISAEIQGDLAVTTGDGMASFAVGHRYWAGDLPLWMKLAWWFSQRPLLMALSGVLIALLLTGPVYMVFARQAKRRLMNEAPAEPGTPAKGDKT